MKKLLASLAAFGLVASGGTAVVACSGNKEQDLKEDKFEITAPKEVKIGEVFELKYSGYTGNPEDLKLKVYNNDLDEVEGVFVDAPTENFETIYNGKARIIGKKTGTFGLKLFGTDNVKTKLININVVENDTEEPDKGNKIVLTGDIEGFVGDKVEFSYTNNENIKTIELTQSNPSNGRENYLKDIKIENGKITATVKHAGKVWLQLKGTFKDDKSFKSNVYADFVAINKAQINVDKTEIDISIFDSLKPYITIRNGSLIDNLKLEQSSGLSDINFCLQTSTTSRNNQLIYFEAKTNVSSTAEFKLSAYGYNDVIITLNIS